MDLTTAARVAAILIPGSTPTQQYSAVIAPFITMVSGMIENYLNRNITIGEYTEYFDVNLSDRVFRLRAYPVTSMSTVRYDTEQVWDSSTIITPDQYRSPVYDPNGLLTLVAGRAVPLGFAARALKVVYTGGMATNTANFIANFPVIATIADRMVAQYYVSRDVVVPIMQQAQPPVLPPRPAYSDAYMKSLYRELDEYRRRI